MSDKKSFLAKNPEQLGPKRESLIPFLDPRKEEMLKKLAYLEQCQTVLCIGMSCSDFMRH